MLRPVRESDRNVEATVYVGNIDEQADETLLYQLMIQAGPVISVSMPKDKISLEHQKFGFVEYQHAKDAEYAGLVLNNVKLFGKPLRVNLASSAPGGEQAEVDVGAELFVGNLDPLVDEKTLENTFSRFGNLTKTPRIARDEEGASKGHGFVSFDSFEAADRAVEGMNNQYLMNRHVKVTYSYKKEGKGQKHGDQAERLLASQARKHKVQLLAAGKS